MMGHKMDMLKHQQSIMNTFGYLMDDYGRAYNESKLRLLEADALEEMKKEFIQSVREEMARANSENAKQFAGEVNKAFKNLGLK